jgi:hypothetical protein
MAHFEIPDADAEDKPFDSLHVWGWAYRQESRESVEPLAYIESLGFKTGVDFLRTEDYTLIENAISTWHRLAPRMRDRIKLCDAFTKPGAKNSRAKDVFYVQGLNDSAAYMCVAPALITALESAGWIYDVTPESTYFAVINGRIIARYQQIIGSRILAAIAE